LPPRHDAMVRAAGAAVAVPPHGTLHAVLHGDAVVSAVTTAVTPPDQIAALKDLFYSTNGGAWHFNVNWVRVCRSGWSPCLSPCLCLCLCLCVLPSASICVASCSWTEILATAARFSSNGTAYLARRKMTCELLPVTLQHSMQKQPCKAIASSTPCAGSRVHTVPARHDGQRRSCVVRVMCHGAGGQQPPRLPSRVVWIVHRPRVSRCSLPLVLLVFLLSTVTLAMCGALHCGTPGT
jgi:hypothetical protein